MKRTATDLLMRDEKGLAIVLALMLVTLLACFGMWLMLETRSGFKITSANQRMEENFHQAEGACWLSIRAIDTNLIELPTTTPISEVTPASLTPNQALGSGKITPKIYSARDFYNTTPPPGWMMNWQGGSGYYRSHYLTRGQSDIALPSTKGNSQSVLYNLAEKVSR